MQSRRKEKKMADKQRVHKILMEEKKERMGYQGKGQTKDRTGRVLDEIWIQNKRYVNSKKKQLQLN